MGVSVFVCGYVGVWVCVGVLVCWCVGVWVCAGVLMCGCDSKCESVRAGV